MRLVASYPVTLNPLAVNMNNHIQASASISQPIRQKPNAPKPPIFGMTSIPMGLPCTLDAWAACVLHCAGEPSIRAQFRHDTGWDVDSALVRTPIEALVDQATGHEAMLMIKFLDWVTIHIWGEEDSAVDIRHTDDDLS